jgi:hypothetical protein
VLPSADRDQVAVDLGVPRNLLVRAKTNGGAGNAPVALVVDRARLNVRPLAVEIAAIWNR